MASCARFGYDDAPSLKTDAGGPSGGRAGMTGASGNGAAGGIPSNGGAAGEGESGSGGTGGMVSDAGSSSSDSGASGAAGGEPDLDAGSVDASSPTCFDDIQNQDETEVDCGGMTCAACPVAPTCFDSIQNQDETGVDCGGATCAACPPAPTCFDSIQNQDEAGVDCGGATCTPCPCSFALPQVLGSPNSAGNALWSPTLSSDGLTMFFSLTVPGFAERVAVATRSSIGNGFGSASALPFPVNVSEDGTPSLSPDGLSLYFFSQRFGGTGDRDLYVATRASTSVQFSAVSELTTVNSTRRDDRARISPDQLTLYFSSQRASLSDDLWRATRNAQNVAFGAPTAVTELNSIGNDSGLSVSADGKVALFASDRTGGLGGVDLYRAVRANASDPFSTPERLTILNSTSDDFDPQLTANGDELFFASTRGGGTYRIWRSLVTCP